MITAIDPTSVKKSGKFVKASNAEQNFSQFMGAMAPAGYEGTLQAQSDPQAASVTHAAMTGLSGATASYNTPYFSSAGYGPGGAMAPMMGTQTIPTLNPGGSTAAPGSINQPVAAGAGGTQPFNNPSQDFLEKDYLLRNMYDSSMNMLVLQAEVQDQNRQFTTVSNMLQSRDRTLHNMIQNMRGM